MNTEEINFRLIHTACGVDTYIAEFAGCNIELFEDKNIIQIIGEDGDHETWRLSDDGLWLFIEGSNGQTPTKNWPNNYYVFLERAIDRLS